jgi:hypothetical protein
MQVGNKAKTILRTRAEESSDSDSDSDWKNIITKKETSANEF